MSIGYRMWTLWKISIHSRTGEETRTRASDVELLTRRAAKLYFADKLFEGGRELIVGPIKPERTVPSKPQRA